MSELSRDDPVAEKVSWEPAKRGGANFKTHRLAVEPGRIRVRRTGGAKLFSIPFVLFGTVVLVAMGIPGLARGDLGTGLFAIVFGSLFVLTGFGISNAMRKGLLTFEKRSCRYFALGYRDAAVPPGARDKGGRLSDIHALQLLQKQITGSESSYISYELNLVFPEGQRVNVMDDRNLTDLKDAASSLGRFLNVPVWEAADRRATARDVVGRDDRPPRKRVSRVVVLISLLVFLSPLIIAAMAMFVDQSPGKPHANTEQIPTQRTSATRQSVADRREELTEGRPEGAMLPAFCTFEGGSADAIGGKHDLWGKTALSVMEAGDRVHRFMRKSEWEPDGVIKQADAAALFYVKDAVEIHYTFLQKAGEPNTCLLSWNRVEAGN